MRQIILLALGLAVAGCGGGVSMRTSYVPATPISVAAAPRVAAPTVGATAGGAKDVGYAREVIERGGIPDPLAITPEGLYSESDLPLGEAPGRDVLALSLGVAVAEGADLVQIGLASSIDAATWRRPPLDLCVVIDVSGSMWDDGKLEAVKRAVVALAKHLRAGDQVSAVAFNKTARVILAPMAVVHDGEAARLVQVTEWLRPGGSTNLYEGLALGFRQVVASGGPRPGRSGRVIVFTDELPTEGATSPDAFIRLATEQGRAGIGLTAFGVGTDFGHDLARQIAACPGGNYRFLRASEDVGGVFETDFDSLVAPIAYDLEVAVTPARGFEVAEAFGFPAEGLRVPTVFLSRSKGALVIRLRRNGWADGAEEIAQDEEARVPLVRLCEVRLRYRLEPTGAWHDERLAALAPPFEPSAGYFSHPGMRKTLALTMLAVAMRDACALPANARAAARLERARDRADDEAVALCDADLAREARLAARLDANLHVQASFAR